MDTKIATSLETSKWLKENGAEQAGTQHWAVNKAERRYYIMLHPTPKSGNYARVRAFSEGELRELLFQYGEVKILKLYGGYQASIKLKKTERVIASTVIEALGILLAVILGEKNEA